MNIENSEHITRQADKHEKPSSFSTALKGFGETVVLLIDGIRFLPAVWKDTKNGK